jgi:siroheme synthase
LSIADVIVYDSLVDPRLLKYCRDDCLLIEGGKRGGLPSVSQSQINQLLVKHCLVGKKVVRLKSGDPLIFGRISDLIDFFADYVLYCCACGCACGCVLIFGKIGSS